MVMAMLKPELASKKASRLRRARGAGIGLVTQEDSLVDHQARSSEMPLVGKKRAKGWTLHNASMISKFVR